MDVGLISAVIGLVLLIFLLVSLSSISTNTKETVRLLEIIANNSTQSSYVEKEQSTNNPEALKALLNKKKVDAVKNIRELIIETRNTMIGESECRERLIFALKEHCVSKEICIDLIKDYSEKYKSNIIEDLKKLSTAYSIVKNLLSVFIEFNVVEKEHPHAIIND